MPRINDELLSAQFENVASDPVTVLVKGRIIWNTTELKAKIYNGTEWTEMGSGAGGSQLTTPLAGEKFDCTNSPRLACISQKKCVTITAANSWIDIDDGGGEVSVQIISSDSTYLLYDLNVSEDAYDLCKVIEDALNASALVLTYNVTYDSSTRKITIADSLLGTNFTIKWNDGVHAASNIGNAIGFLVAANDSGANTYTADNPIDDSTNTSLFEKTFATQTDSAYIVKSRNFRGVVETTTEKMNAVTIKWDLEVDDLTTSDGEKYYTDSSAIVIETGVNDAIDFNEGGAEKNATLTAGTYYRGTDSDIGYRTLCAEIKAQLESANGTALTYTVTFNKNTNLFAITVSSGTFQIVWATGTNTATACYDELGWTAADTASSGTLTSPSAVENVGNLIVASDSLSEHAVYVGHGLPDSKTFIGRDASESIYDPIYSAPGDWLNTPEDKDFGEEFILCDQHENSNGVGARLLVTTTSPSDYMFQYKTGPGMPWVDGTTTIAVGKSAAKAITGGEDFGGNYFYNSKVFVDENGKMACAIYRIGTHGDVWSYYSEDGGDTWSVGNGGSPIYSEDGVRNVYVEALYIRANKAVIVCTNATHNLSKLGISNYSSGYGTWNTVDVTNDYAYFVPVNVLIQSYPNAVGDATHRIVILGTKNADNDLYVQYYDAAGANEANVKPFTTSTRAVYAACLDSQGSGNTVLLVASDYTPTVTLDVAISNDSDSSFTMSDKGDINSGGSTVDLYNGYSASNRTNNLFNVTRRCVLYGNYVYIIASTAANAGSKYELGFWRSDDLGTSWESKVDVGQSANNQEGCIAYIPSIHSIMVAYNYFPTAAAGANFLLNGQVWVRLGEIQGDGSISWHDAEQIDGGKAEANNVQFVMISSSADGANVSWEEYDGAARDTLKSNKFI